MLVKYLRNKSGKMVGVVVAIDKDKVGMSLCSPKDVFNKEFGKMVAVGRAKLGFPRHVPNIPNRKDIDSEQLISEFDSMEDRAERYFKN